MIESVSHLQRSHDSLNASMAGMEQSNDESLARVEQSLHTKYVIIVLISSISLILLYWFSLTALPMK